MPWNIFLPMLTHPTRKTKLITFSLNLVLFQQRLHALDMTWKLQKAILIAIVTRVMGRGKIHLGGVTFHQIRHF
jgi:hypothetical protein